MSFSVGDESEENADVPDSVRGIVRRAFVTGVALIVPLVVTAFIISLAVGYIDSALQSVATPIVDRSVGPDQFGTNLVKVLTVAIFLAVAPDERGDGHGKRLVAAVAEEYGTVTCHARTSNQNALDFYRNIGFETVRTIENYYEDYGDAYYLRLGEDSFTEKLSRFFRR